MKTTIDLPDALFVAAKKRAAEERRPLRDLVAEGLRARLRRAGPAVAGTVPIEWVTVKGDLPDDIDLSDRNAMYERLKSRR